MDLVKVLIILLLLLIAGCIMYIDHSGDGEVVVEFFDSNDVPVTLKKEHYNGTLRRKK